MENNVDVKNSEMTKWELIDSLSKQIKAEANTIGFCEVKIKNKTAYMGDPEG